MSKKDRGAFQRKRAQKAAKQKAKKAKSQRSARHDVPVAYTGSRYQSPRYTMPLMVAEAGIRTADIDSGNKLRDSDVRAALAVMVKRLHTGPQDLFTALNGLRESEFNDVRQRQIVLSVTANWLDFFEVNPALPRAHLVGILRTLVNSLNLRTEMHPGGRGYLTFLSEFLPEAIAAMSESEYLEPEDADGDDDEPFDEMVDHSDNDLFDEADTVDVAHRPPNSTDND